MHGAPANRSDKVREAMTANYFPDGARITDMSRSPDGLRFVGGLVPGQLADGVMNPIVYSENGAGGRGEVTGQWSPERANEWFASIPLPFGCNFLPSTAVNSTEMWQADTFDPVNIERELLLAAGLGYNTVRVFLQFMVWEADPAGHNERLETFLRLADAAGITMMPILFDDCRFDDRDPYPGPQDEPKPGVHNSRWTPSPGYATADDPARWPQLKAYVSDVVGSLPKRPPRVGVGPVQRAGRGSPQGEPAAGAGGVPLGARRGSAAAAGPWARSSGTTT